MSAGARDLAGLAGGLLGGHVARGPQDLPGRREAASDSMHLGQAEIGDPGPPVVSIRMFAGFRSRWTTVRMGVLDRLGDSAGPARPLRSGAMARRRPVATGFVPRRSPSCRNVGRSEPDVVDRHDPRMFEQGGGLRFRAKPLDQ